MKTLWTTGWDKWLGGVFFLLLATTRAAIAADPLVDAVILVVPPVLHKELCLAAVAARKPVLIEKPLATTYRDACVMVEAAARAGVPFMTAHTLRFDATVQSLLASRTRIGQPRQLVLTSHLET